MKFLNRMLKGMKNNELEKISDLVFAEQERRANKRIHEGRYEILNHEEKRALVDDRGEAVNMYCVRTGCPEAMAQLIMDL